MPKQPMCQRKKIMMEIRKHFEVNEMNTQHAKTCEMQLSNAQRVSYNCKHPYLKNKKSEIYNQNYHRAPGKVEQTKTKASRKMEIIQNRVDNSEVEDRSIVEDQQNKRVIL